jgi:putative SOS response-associated peptidase YedK
MCGRFTSTTSASDLATWFDVGTVLVEELQPDHNVTPTRDIYIVREEAEERLLDTARWGLVPSWAEDPRIGARLINARSETAAQKPSFRSAFRRRRCLIPVDGFYEWSPMPGQRRKQPWYFSAQDGGPLAFAGLWESWRSPDTPDAAPLSTCTILTGPPNAVVAPIHDRMPVILGRSSWDAWLDPANEVVDALSDMLGPAPDDLLSVWPVSLAVNDVHRHDDALVEPVEPPEQEVQDSLF